MTTPGELRAIADTWLSSFASALSSGDAQAVAATFLPNGWLRDVLTFTWDNRSLEGREKIANYLSERLPGVAISEVKLNEDKHFLPERFSAGPAHGIEFGYTYETGIAHGMGLVRLVQDEQGQWGALIVSAIIVDLKGFEETPGRQNFEDSTKDLPWSEYQAGCRARVETDPHVLIIGGGQTGLMVAARFKQMNIPALLIERNKRIGDNWRQRYLSLALHTVREHHQLLYQQHPSTWPLYTPRDKIAGMLETYAVNQDLIMWTSTKLSGQPSYDAEKKQWSVTVDRDGTEVVLHPTHIVLATGTLGGPRMPTLPGRELFKGTAIHATQYCDPKIYTGKTVLVVGAGNTSIDICQDLVIAKAKSVAMIQRSCTCVVSRENVNSHLAEVWQQGRPVEVSDFKFASVPLGFQKKLMISMQAESWAEEEVLHAKVRKGGVKVSIGPEGQGQFLLVFERAGGYWLDKGGADLIESGDIKVKQGEEPTAFTEIGLLFTDGSELPADVVIFATGYTNIRDVNKELFGEDVINKTSAVWGLDHEGEVQGGYRPSGHPGFWYATGDFFNSRFQSKQLAIQIKAIELGYMKQ